MGMSFESYILGQFEYMMMKNFRKLSLDVQLDLLDVCGILLMECKGLRVGMTLFSFGNFYVEVFSELENERIIMINAFDDVESLEPYLQQIDISELAVF